MTEPMVPQITVLMAVYNGEKCLNHTIESILNQSFQNFEFLIVNDCSTDNTIELIKSFEDPRIRIHNNAVNLGQTKSLNVGLKLTKGKYIARMDADDYAMPERLAGSDSELISIFGMLRREHALTSVL